VGYVPCDKDNEAVAKGLEYAYNDWCIAVLADSLGDKETAEKYHQYAKNYQQYFDSSIGFMRGKTLDGQWRTPFSPNHSEHRVDDFCEGNSYQWSWFVPHDVDGLAELYGGKEGMIKKLDELFSASSEMEGENVSADISGLIGQYAHGNEPSHHITHFYNYLGQPWRTQELVDQVLTTLYFNAPDGLSGNEDCGQMSAWYILNAMGFYQVCAGNPVYSIGRPLFKEAIIHLPNGKNFTIGTLNNAPQNKYIKAIRLNGEELKEPFFTHEQLMAGGLLQIEMTNTPQK
jgi:predicted alpha-1,2-mannosidase